MPYADRSDKCGSTTRRPGRARPSCSCTNSPPTIAAGSRRLREFGKRYRCIAYAARGYTPSDVPADTNAYSYQHVMRDAVAVLDHLKIDKAHLIGLSMGGYTSLQVALNHPERVRSMMLAGTGSGSERWYTADFHKHSRATRRPVRARRRGRGGQDLRPRREPHSVRAQGPARLCRICRASGRARCAGSAHTSRGFQGARPSLYDFEDAIRRLDMPALIVVGDEDDRCIEPGLFLKDTLPPPVSSCCRRPATRSIWRSPTCSTRCRRFPRPRRSRPLGRRAIRAPAVRAARRRGTSGLSRSLSSGTAKGEARC